MVSKLCNDYLNDALAHVSSFSSSIALEADEASSVHVDELSSRNENPEKIKVMLTSFTLRF